VCHAFNMESHQVETGPAADQPTPGRKPGFFAELWQDQPIICRLAGLYALAITIVFILLPNLFSANPEPVADPNQLTYGDIDVFTFFCSFLGGFLVALLSLFALITAGFSLMGDMKKGSRSKVAIGVSGTLVSWVIIFAVILMTRTN